MLRHIVAVGFALAAGSALAAPVARQGGDSVQLLDKPCSADVAKFIPENARELYRAAVAVIGGQQYDACWTPVPSRGVVHLHYEDGDQGMAPMRDFHDEPNI